VSRDNHANLRLNAIASGVFMATFAGAVYANGFWLITHLWRMRRYAAFAVALLLVLALVAFACTLAIDLAYDLLCVWGDPARFGFSVNLGMEFRLVGTPRPPDRGRRWLFERTRKRSG